MTISALDGSSLVNWATTVGIASAANAPTKMNRIMNGKACWFVEPTGPARAMPAASAEARCRLSRPAEQFPISPHPPLPRAGEGRGFGTNWRNRAFAQCAQ